jgi:hypothetical protein
MEIAQTQKLATDWGKAAFVLGDEEINQMVVRARAKWEKIYPGSRAIGWYLEVIPLLLEHKAIQAFLHETGRMGLQGALPEAVSPKEAARLMAEDRMLNPEETQQFEQMLDQQTRESKWSMRLLSATLNQNFPEK